MITPALVLETIKAVALAAVELLKFYQTEQGKRVIDQMIADRQAWDAGWQTAQTNILAFFKKIEAGG